MHRDPDPQKDLSIYLPFSYLTAVQVIMASPNQLVIYIFLVPQFLDWTH